MPRHRPVAALALWVFGLQAAAQAPAVESAPESALQTIQVTGDLETELVSYGVLFRMAQAVDGARAQHGPQARIRFRLVNGQAPEGEEETAPLPAVRLLGDGLDLDIGIAKDRTFELPFDASYLDKHPRLLVTPRRYARNISVLIATPGVPGHALRLGDLRLVCIAHQQLALETAGWMSRLAIRMMGLNACKVRMGASADAVVPRIKDGPKSADLTKADSQFIVPVADSTWSSDALIHMPPAPPRAAP